MRMQPWRVLESKYLIRTPWLKVRVDQVETARGVLIPEYPVIEGSDWACIVPVTASGALVLVRQYRHGFRGATLEFPAGAIDGGEDPLAGAQRELSEETGCSSDQWTHLLSVSPETTRHHHRAHLFLARQVEQVAQQRLEATEDVTVCTHPLAQAEELIPQLSHAVHTLALVLALRHLKA
jgi:8-oxo-dGTP pyrophosphatase MutT (NUDIX family)